MFALDSENSKLALIQVTNIEDHFFLIQSMSLFKHDLYLAIKHSNFGTWNITQIYLNDISSENVLK
jgi:hypothetical protein